MPAFFYVYDQLENRVTLTADRLDLSTSDIEKFEISYKNTNKKKLIKSEYVITNASGLKSAAWSAPRSDRLLLEDLELALKRFLKV